jgi:uncharacterized membrane protein YccC
MSQAGLRQASLSGGGWAGHIAPRLRAARPALLFGLRLWAAVCLAFYIAFALELDNAFWAATSAAIVCQPSLGASLRKGWFRIIGTIVGAVAVVVVTGLFPQQRVAFLLALALWSAACAFLTTLLRNFAAYGAALAGFTVAIIAADTLGATGGPSGTVFTFALARGAEISIGVVSAGVVLALTDLGGAPRRLATLFAGLSAEIAGQFCHSLAHPEADTRSLRRGLLRQVIALDPVIDEVYGESTRLRPASPVLEGAVDGLFAALGGWRAIATHLERLPPEEARAQAAAVARHLPQELGAPVDAELWRAAPQRLRRSCAAAVRVFVAEAAGTPAARLLADKAAMLWIALSEALNGVALLIDAPYRPARRRTGPLFEMTDWLPPLVNAGRALVTILAMELLWVVTQWPNGAFAITFAAIGVILFARRADDAYETVLSFMLGTTMTIGFAAAIKFALLPQIDSFAGFCLALGLVLIPAGALMAQPWQNGMFMAIAANFVPLLAPANQMTYDTAQFANTALAIVTGVCAAVLSFRLMPPLSPALRARRLLAVALRDVRRLASRPMPGQADRWQHRMYDRLAALPDQADTLQAARFLAALSVGREIIRLRRFARRLAPPLDAAPALAALARGDSAAARAGLALLDGRLAAQPAAGSQSRLQLRARGGILAISEALALHADYFDGTGR